jgi:hypothetical protein
MMREKKFGVKCQENSIGELSLPQCGAMFLAIKNSII